jgi:hypothetical protein
VAVAMGCAGRSPHAPDFSQPVRQPELRPLPEEFDPEILGDDLLLIEPVAAPAAPALRSQSSVLRPAAAALPWSPAAPQPALDDSARGMGQTDSQTRTGPAATVPQHLVEAFGWRVLLDKVHSYEEAEQVRQQAMASLARTDIDIKFKAPWYNIELGHYQAEAEAQQALEGVKERFPNALKVRGQIFIPAEE